MFLAEIPQQGNAAAEVRFREAQKRAQEDIGHHLFMLGFFWSMKCLTFLQIPVAEQQQAMGRQTVPAGPADLLVVGFDALRQIVMDDKADVGLVDPHAEGDCRHDDLDIVADEELLVRVRSVSERPAW